MLGDVRFYIVYVALLSGILGLFYRHKLPDYKSRLVLFLIWFTALIEIVGKYFTGWTGLLNYCVFNVYIIVTFTAYITILKGLLKKEIYKDLSWIFMAIFIGYFIINALYMNPVQYVLTNSYVVGVIVTAILSFLYLLEVFSSDLVLNYTKSFFFWFILGILIFHIPYLPFMLSLDWFLIEYNPSVYGLILFFLNLLMNFCFAAGFIWSEKKYNY